MDHYAGTKGARWTFRSLAENRFKHTSERRIRNRLGGNKNHNAFERHTALETSIGYWLHCDFVARVVAFDVVHFALD